jgi:HD-GYP domain-containing protein (c-di-GMP phosphodiesterase class II)
VAQLVIWGDPRTILAEELPPGLAAETVSSLAGLAAAVDGRGPALVLADVACVDAERDKALAWSRDGGHHRVVLLGVTEADRVDDALARLPFVEDVIERPVTAPRLRRRLERAIEAVNARRSIRQLEAALARKGSELSDLNAIGVALSAERDIDALLTLILAKSREITCADAGSLYLVERGAQDAASGETTPDRLRFKLAQNDTVEVPFEEFTMPLDDASIAGHVALAGKLVNVADAYRLPEGSTFRISRSFDQKSGYRTKSVLVVPMRDHENAIIGVVQLINKKRDPKAVLQPVALVEEEVVPFTSVDEELAESLASQAAVAFENAKLLQDIRALFDRFVRAAAKAVEQRDPVTSGHSERVAELTVALAQAVDRVATGPYGSLHFTREQIQEIRYAGLLHDFGKVAVQEKYLCKEKKLYATELIALRQRFAFIQKAHEAAYLRARLEAVASGRATPERLAALEKEFESRQAQVQQTLEVVLAANEPTVVEEDRFSILMNLPTRRFGGADLKSRWKEESLFPVEDWAEPPYLSEDEVKALSIRRGSLDAEERQEIERHVSHTYEFLRQIPWTGDLAKIPLIAWAHHEKLDGSGYPRRIKSEDIPPQSKMMTISDIFDALVALDRPYKKAQPVDRALRILEDEARQGKLDPDLLNVFCEARLFEIKAFTDRLLPRAGR